MAQGDMHALGHSDNNQDCIITSGPTFDVEDDCDNSPDGHLGGVSLDELKGNSLAVNRPLPSDINLQELAELTCLEDIKSTMAFIQALQVASLDDEHNGLSKDTVKHLQNPPTSPIGVKNPNF